MLNVLKQHIRFPNLLMLALVQWLTYFLFSETFAHIYLFLIVLATLLIATGGYLLNDIFDAIADKINHKKDNINTSLLYRIYWFVSLLGLGLGLMVSLQTHSYFLLWFIIPFVTLACYARWLSHYKIIGNIVVSLLIAVAILIIPCFAIVENSTIYTTMPKAISYALFAFLLNWIREIVKDIEDQIGDKAIHRKTIPIVFGLFYTKICVSFLILCTILALYFLPLFEYFFIQYAFHLLLLFWLFFCLNSTEKKDFTKLSFLLKIIMLIGLLLPLV